MIFPGSNADAERYVGELGMWISGATQRIEGGRGLLLSVKLGAVRVALEGSAGHAVIEAGGSFRIGRGKRVLVSAAGREHAAAITLAPSAAAPARAQPEAVLS